MAASVIDALVVSLNLDSSKFTEGQQKARKELGDTKDAEKKRADAAVAASKEMERAANNVVQAYSKVRNEILGLFGLLLAGRGLKQFVSDIEHGDASVGYMAKSLNMATDELAAWQQVAERSGGTAAGITGSFQKLSETLYKAGTLGEYDSGFFQALSRLGVAPVDATTGKLKSMSEILKEIAGPLSKMSAPEANIWGGLLGIDNGTIATLRQNGGGRPALEAALAKAREHGVVSEKDAENAQKVLNAFKDIYQSVESIGRAILSNLSGPLIHMLTEFDAWLDKNKVGLGEGIGGFIGSLITKLTEFAEKIGPAQTAALAFLGLWETKNLVGALFGMGSLRLGILGIVGALVELGLQGRDLSTLKPDSPLWLGIPPEEQRKYKNSPLNSPDGPTYFEQFRKWWSGTGGGAVSGSVPPEGRALLNAIAGSESNGTYADQYSSTGARGRYQFLQSTWSEVSKQTGLSEWTPENQDQNAWFYAQQMFKAKGGPGGDLGAFLRSGGDPSPWLKGTWVSLPGGSEWNKQTDGFRSRLGAFMSRENNAIPNGANPAITGGIGPQSMRLPSVWDNQMAGAKTLANNNNFSFGPMTIQTAATDAKGIARDLQSQIQRKLFTSNFNSGLA
jgi:hypothetical protein